MKTIRLFILWCALVALLPIKANGPLGPVICGDEQTDRYLPLLKGKRVALFCNQTARVGCQLLPDLLVAHHIKVACVLSPEHGFRGNADAGERVESGVDAATGIPIRSLYGGNDTVPLNRYLRDRADLLVVDIQDVGLRFYTYYITMLKLMNICAAERLPVIVLDRPNPNGFYVDGPILDMKHRSGVGALPIPVVHGMTLGELARMINGEGWLERKLRCRLTVIPCRNYTHSTRWQLPVAPSPNLPTMKAVYLYPSMCYFEGTVMSVGRGTDKPFLLYGHPKMKGGNCIFTPRSRSGAKCPPLLGLECHGVDLSTKADSAICSRGLDLSYLIDAYRRMDSGDRFFTPFFEKLIGVDYVRRMIEEDKDADEIKAMWKDDVEQFKRQRQPYLLYKP